MKLHFKSSSSIKHTGPNERGIWTYDLLIELEQKLNSGLLMHIVWLYSRMIISDLKKRETLSIEILDKNVKL